MTVEAASTAPKSCPFPGPASYDYDSRGAFFGREQEAIGLSSAILAQRLSVLTAGSGDGKTSLLHAAVAPLLYRARIEVVLAEPGGQSPVAAVGSACMSRLIPPRQGARDLIARLMNAFGTDCSLTDARLRCRELDNFERQSLLIGRFAQRPSDLLEGGPLVTWLRDDAISPDYLADAMHAITPKGSPQWSGVGSKLTEVAAFFDGADILEAPDWADTSDDAIDAALAIMEQAIILRTAADDDFQLVLVIDQFEEIFVQFKTNDPSTKGGVDRWRHRNALMGMLSKMLARNWPLRIVLSLRKEYYADLQVALAEPGGLAKDTYHLGPLTDETAKSCLLREGIWRLDPPTTGQVESVVGSLKVDDQFVDPTLLSVSGEWLWRRDDLGTLAPEALGESVKAAVIGFVRRGLTEPDVRGGTWSGADQQEAIDILNSLIIRDGSEWRRNSVALSTIVDARFRNPSLRRRLVDDLQRRRLVRIERRLGGEYIEVVHEKLIEAVRSVMRELRGGQDQMSSLPALLDDLAYDPNAIRLNPLTPTNRNAVLSNISRLQLSSVVAASLVTRLLLDPNFLTAWHTDPSGWRRVIHQLAQDANAEDASTVPDLAEPHQRFQDGLLASPSEIENELLMERREGRTDIAEFYLACALLQRDTGAMERVRRCARRLRETST